MYIMILLQHFIDYLAENRGLSPHTLSGYRFDLSDFCTWFKDTNGDEPEPEDVTSIDLREYQSYLQNVRKQKPGTINRRFINAAENTSQFIEGMKGGKIMSSKHLY